MVDNHGQANLFAITIKAINISTIIESDSTCIPPLLLQPEKAQDKPDGYQSI